MSDFVDLLVPDIQSDFRRAMQEHGFPERYSNMQDETLVSLSLIGEHPEDLRGPALTITPPLPRAELHACGLAEVQERRPAAWRLTSEGDRLAELLAATAPRPTSDEEFRAKEDLERFVAEAKEELRSDRSREEAP